MCVDVWVDRQTGRQAVDGSQDRGLTNRRRAGEPAGRRRPSPRASVQFQGRAAETQVWRQREAGTGPRPPVRRDSLQLRAGPAFVCVQAFD